MEKKIALCATKKINILTLVLSKKTNSERKKKLGNRLSLLKKKDISSIINAEASEGVDNMDSDGEDTFSLASRSQEGDLFYPTMKFALLFLTKGSNLHVLWVVHLHLWMVDHPFSQGEDENPSAVGYREALRHRVYTIRREL